MCIIFLNVWASIFSIDKLFIVARVLTSLLIWGYSIVSCVTDFSCVLLEMELLMYMSLVHSGNMYKNGRAALIGWYSSF